MCVFVCVCVRACVCLSVAYVAAMGVSWTSARAAACYLFVAVDKGTAVLYVAMHRSHTVQVVCLCERALTGPQFVPNGQAKS